MYGDVLNEKDWSGYFRTWSEQLAHCSSEEDLYRKIRKFKDEFNTDYGKLSRRNRRKKGFRYTEDE